RRRERVPGALLPGRAGPEPRSLLQGVNLGRARPLTRRRADAHGRRRPKERRADRVGGAPHDRGALLAVSYRRPLPPPPGDDRQPLARIFREISIAYHVSLC